jgi:NTP pyrophosphatase (non-canonical NTP hydrolase)
MKIAEMQKKAFETAKNSGFHNPSPSVAKMLMLIVSELSEALEIDRKKGVSDDLTINNTAAMVNLEKDPDSFKQYFEDYVKNSFGDELADVIIRVGDLAELKKIDLSLHIKMKMKYNELREYKHGKRY